MRKDGSFPPPPPVVRPKFYGWMKARNLNVADVAPILGVSVSGLSQNLMPVLSRYYRPPVFRTRQAIRDYTRGEVAIEDWPEKSSDNSPRNQQERV